MKLLFTSLCARVTQHCNLAYSIFVSSFSCIMQRGTQQNKRDQSNFGILSTVKMGADKRVGYLFHTI